MAGDDQHAPITHRHPELVSGPISRFTRSKRWQTQPRRQVGPMRVAVIDKVDLPLPMPALQLLFAQDRWLHFTEQFVVDKSVDRVARGKPRHCVIAMLPQARDEVGGYADVNRTVVLARKDINAREPFITHGPEIAAQWVLKQVQDDEFWEVVL